MAIYQMQNRNAEYRHHYDEGVRLERKRVLGVLAHVNTCPELRSEIWSMALDGTTPDIAANKLLALKAKGAYGRHL